MRNLVTIHLALALTVGCTGSCGGASEAAPAEPSPTSPSEPTDPEPTEEATELGQLSCPGSSAEATGDDHSPAADEEPDDGRMTELREAPFIVVGTVSERDSWVRSDDDEERVYGFAVVTIRSYLKGETADVFEAYRRSFPVYDLELVQSLDEGGGHGHAVPGPTSDLAQGETYVLGVHLPGRTGNVVSEDGPPEPLAERFGPYTVGVVFQRPASARGEVARALREIERADAAAEARAEQMSATDRFGVFARERFGEGPIDESRAEEAASVARDFVALSFRERLSVTLEMGEPEMDWTEDERRIRFPFTASHPEARLPDGHLDVIVRLVDGRVKHFAIRWDGLEAFEEGPARFDPNAVADAVRQALDLEVRGGEPQVDVNRSYSAHTQLFVAFSAGRVYEGSTSHYLASTTVTATPRCLAITRYSYDWE